MSEQKKNLSNTESQQKLDYGMPIALGLCLGTAIGVSLGNSVYGMLCGLNIGLLVGAISAKKQDHHGANIAIIISFLALLFVVILWIVT